MKGSGGVACQARGQGQGRGHLSPDLEERVPRARAERSAVHVDAEARDAIVVTLKREDELALERVPDTAVVVVVASKEEAARDGEGDGGNTDEDAVAAVGGELTVSAEVPHAARRIVSASREAKAILHDLHRVDVTLMASERLRRLASADIPVLGVRVDSARHKGAIVRQQREGHDVAIVALELADLQNNIG